MADDAIRAEVGALLARLAADGKVETGREQHIMHWLAYQFNQPVPKYACPACWLGRLIDAIPRALTTDHKLRERVKV